jgi:hypothetical protein
MGSHRMSPTERASSNTTISCHVVTSVDIGENSLLQVLCVRRQPRFNHFSLKSPLLTHFKPWKLFSAQEPIDGNSVHAEIFGDFVNRKQAFRRVNIFLHGLAFARAMSAPTMKEPKTAQLLP